MTAAIIFLLCWMILLAAGTTPIGRFLSWVMVIVPARAVKNLEPGHVTLAIVVTMLIVLHLAAEDGDPIRMMGLLAPDVAIWLTSFEIGALVDASFVAVATLATLRRTGIGTVLRAVSKRLPSHPKNNVNRARTGPRSARRLPANDDDDRADLARAS